MKFVVLCALAALLGACAASPPPAPAGAGAAGTQSPYACSIDEGYGRRGPCGAIR